MKKAGKNVIENSTLIMALVLGLAQLISGGLYAQGQRSASDSALTSKYRIKDAYNLSGLPYSGSGKGGTDTYSNSIKSLGQYRLTLAKNFSIQAGGHASYLPSPSVKYMQGETAIEGTTDGTTNLNPNNFRRGDLGLRGIRLNIQHFTLGASSNYGLNNIGRSGDMPQNSKNPGLSLHAGLTF